MIFYKVFYIGWKLHSDQSDHNNTKLYIDYTGFGSGVMLNPAIDWMEGRGTTKLIAIFWVYTFEPQEYDYALISSHS